MRRMFVRIVFRVNNGIDTRVSEKLWEHFQLEERGGEAGPGCTFSTSEYLAYLSGFINSALDSHDIEKQEGPALIVAEAASTRP